MLAHLRFWSATAKIELDQLSKCLQCGELSLQRVC